MKVGLFLPPPLLAGSQGHPALQSIEERLCVSCGHKLSVGLQQGLSLPGLFVLWILS